MTQEIAVVYHCAGMGNWRDVVSEQGMMLYDADLTELRMTHVGDGLEECVATLARYGVRADVCFHSPNVRRYEGPAMLEVERQARSGLDRPLLYFHTKGVSAPDDAGKAHWRRAMQRQVVLPWRENLTLLDGYGGTHDAAGVNWFPSGRHFSGTFWIATPEWLRKLPDFANYFLLNRNSRYACENWIGAGPGLRAASLGIGDAQWWWGQSRAEWDALEEYPSPVTDRPLSSRPGPVTTYVAAVRPPPPKESPAKVVDRTPTVRAPARLMRGVVRPGARTVANALKAQRTEP